MGSSTVKKMNMNVDNKGIYNSVRQNIKNFS